MALPFVFILTLLPLVMLIVLGLIIGVGVVSAISQLAAWLRRPAKPAA